MKFTADPHFYHKNIMASCNGVPSPWLADRGASFSAGCRNFNSYEEMNGWIIQNWNEDVTSDNEEVFCLGDMVFGGVANWQILQHLRGKVFIVPGNHDPKPAQLRRLLPAHWTVLPVGHTLSVPGFPVVSLTHYPIKDWTPTNAVWNLHGHCHTDPETPPHQMTRGQYDVGLDFNDYRLVTLGYIATRSWMQGR